MTCALDGCEAAPCARGQHPTSCVNTAGREDYFASLDHSKPHWCKHDGGPALVQPPEWTVLYYAGAAASTPDLQTRDCPYA